MTINRTAVWLVALGAFTFGGYAFGRATANREWAKLYFFSQYLHVADMAAKRSFVLADLRSKPREQLIERLEKEAVPSLEMLADAEQSMAADSGQWSNLEQNLKYVSAYYRDYPDSRLSPKARRALQIAESAP